jgi:hypothetical protein
MTLVQRLLKDCVGIASARTDIASEKAKMADHQSVKSHQK